MKYVFLKRKLNKENYDYTRMSVTQGDKTPSHSTVKKWVASFRTGHLSTENQEHSGTPTQVTIPVNVDAIH